MNRPLSHNGSIKEAGEYGLRQLENELGIYEIQVVPFFPFQTLTIAAI